MQMNLSDSFIYHQYLLGRTPREIFEATGFNVEMLGIKRVEQCAGRWKKAYDKDGTPVYLWFVLENKQRHYTEGGSETRAELEPETKK